MINMESIVEDKIVVVDEEEIKQAPKGSKVALTSEQERKVIRMYEKGEKVRDIQIVLKITAGRVYRILNRNGIKMRQPVTTSEAQLRYMALSKYEKDRIVDEYIRGVTISTIRTRYNLNKTSLYKVLDERGITRRSEKLKDNQVKVHKKNKIPVEAYIQDKTVYIDLRNKEVNNLSVALS